MSHCGDHVSRLDARALTGISSISVIYAETFLPDGPARRNTELKRLGDFQSISHWKKFRAKFDSLHHCPQASACVLEFFKLVREPVLLASNTTHPTNVHRNNIHQRS